MVRHIRIHGRGGEGVKLAGRILSRAAFLAGRTIQDSPLYGAERRGAPVVAFARIADGPILERGYIDVPDVVVVMDASLLGQPQAAVLDGVDAETLVLVNSTRDARELVQRFQGLGQVVVRDVSAIAIEILGQAVLSAPMAGFVTRALGLASWTVLEEAIRIELAAAGVESSMVERNVAATRRIFDGTAAAIVRERCGQTPKSVAPLFVLPRLPAASAAPSIVAPATSARRTTHGWRVYRPVIELEQCTRCCICFALCPEGAIHFDDSGFPAVDYAHCKGCLVCVTECPPQVIRRVR